MADGGRHVCRHSGQKGYRICEEEEGYLIWQEEEQGQKLVLSDALAVQSQGLSDLIGYQDLKVSSLKVVLGPKPPPTVSASIAKCKCKRMYKADNRNYYLEILHGYRR